MLVEGQYLRRFYKFRVTEQQKVFPLQSGLKTKACSGKMWALHFLGLGFVHKLLYPNPIEKIARNPDSSSGAAISDSGTKLNDENCTNRFQKKALK